MKEWYVLTDGMSDEPADEKFMSPDEAQQTSEHARDATDGTWYWALKYPPTPDPNKGYLYHR